jgi:uncharacterized membrane protein
MARFASDRVMKERIRRTVRVLAAAALVAVGVDHFVKPDFFTRIVPHSLPAPLLLVWISGFFEVIGGLGLLVPPVRRAAGIGLVLLFVAVFPANINMAMHPALGGSWPPWALYTRLPFQVVFIATALWVSGDG